MKFSKRGCKKNLIFWKNRFFQTRPWKSENQNRRQETGDFDLTLDHGRYEKNVIFPYLQKLAFFLIILIYLLINPGKMVHAQDSLLDPSDNTIQGTDWDSLEQRDTKYQMYKVVTPQQFDAAMQQMQSLKDKKGKNGKKGRKSKAPEEMEVPEIPDSPNPLLRLPADITYGDTVIKEGFYLVDAVQKNDKYFLILKQGYNNVAEIEAKAENYTSPSTESSEEPPATDDQPDTPPPDKGNKKRHHGDSQGDQSQHFRKRHVTTSVARKADAEIINDKMKIDYYERGIELEAILPIYKQE